MNLFSTFELLRGTYRSAMGFAISLVASSLAAASETKARGQTEATAVNDLPAKIERVEVIATRIDGINNKGLLQGGEAAPLYHTVVTHQEIERLGISSVEELFRYIPQSSSTITSLQAAASNTSATGGLFVKSSTIGLRGFSSAQTAVLINGRSLPRTGLFDIGGADISRIPLAAIERVEILPYAGSAIYGAGAIGGAINVILRKDYTGRDLTTFVGTSTEGGATEYRLSYREGRVFNVGKTNLTFTLSYQHRDALRANERDYLEEALRRYGPNSTAVNAQGVRVFESLILPSFAGAPGTILVGNPPSAAVNDLGVPGSPGVRYAAIPVGTTAAASLSLTPASFAATAGQATLSPRYGRSILYEPVGALSFNAEFEHSFIKDKLESYGEFTVGRNRKDYSMPQQLALSLGATDPLNPFRTGVTPGFVGRPITILLDTPDIRDPSVSYRDDAVRGVGGFKGNLTERWAWSVDGLVDYAHSTLTSDNPTDNLTGLINLSPTGNPGPAAPAETRRAIYPIFSDHARFPLSETDSRKYFESVRASRRKSVQYEANARLLGELAQLPAGPLRTSLAGKYQYFDYKHGQALTGSSAWSQLVNNGPVPDNPSPSHGTRKIWMGALEVSGPIIGPKWRPLPVESFEVQASVSFERAKSGVHSSMAPSFINRQSADSRVLAGKLQITRDVAVRASYSEGFYPPEWGTVSQPVTTFQLPGFFADPRRGNTMQFTPLMTIFQGGNPDLKPETADSKVFGLMLTPRFLPKFSLNLDYWKISKVDAVVSQSFTDVIANPDSYGFLLTREAATADDAAKGWLGRITAVDARVFNAARTTTEGIDVRARYSLETAAGTFDFSAGGSFTNRFLLQATSTSPAINTAGGSGPVRWRANSSLTWSSGRWSTTFTARYIGHRSTNTTTPSPSYPGASSLDGERLASLLRWDLQAAYEIPYAAGTQRGWRGWHHGSRFSLGVLNVLNDQPTFVSNGSGYYDTSDDPRQRFVYAQIKKSF
jgi:iron complex outermembrane receptor protein